MTEQGGMENRQLRRVPFERDVEVMGWKTVRSSQLGLGGMYLMTEEPLPQGKEIILRFKLSPQKPEILTVNARVLYTHAGKGFGLAFKNLPWETLEKISEFMEGE